LVSENGGHINQKKYLMVNLFWLIDSGESEGKQESRGSNNEVLQTGDMLQTGDRGQR
jgi:hypothetical protein